MTVTVDEKVIDILLLGQGDRQRLLHDLPIRGDVWAEIARAPGELHDLLISPHHDHSAARVARMLADLTVGEPVGHGARRMSYLTGLVAARLSLEDIWSVLIPMTEWWRRTVGELADWPGDALSRHIVDELEACILRERTGSVSGDEARDLARRERELETLRNAERQVVRLGLLVGLLRAAAAGFVTADDAAFSAAPGDTGRLARLAAAFDRDEIARLGEAALHQALYQYRQLEAREADEGRPMLGLVWSASANRRAEYATSRSVPAIKADAARQLFSISCRDIGWAILDSGIDHRHPAFEDLNGKTPGRSRIRATYDFGAIRDILNTGNRFDDDARIALAERLALATGRSASAIEETLKDLAGAIGDERAVDWNAVEPLVRRDDPDPPDHPHGTHVAGILGGYWRRAGATPADPPVIRQTGVCPDIMLYDFRVLGPDAEQTEFAVIAALQFIGFLNRRNAYPVIDGINMSLSIAHNVRNYACGYTPICVEAEARVAQGTTVVVAAGNRGYQQFRLADGTEFASYAASSITDPGNAEGVITVGSTHRFWPHTYGVSFFSSRGPTGDGRIKPDIVAPGERIESCIPKDALDVQDGTSMAAPHVSGAAALLMARHRELRRRPDRIKRILCSTATDLGRERSFQGAGMVDVLRAIQAV